MSISIITVTYNSARFIPRYLSSICQQSLLPQEVVVVDSNSTDNSCQLLSSFDRLKLSLIEPGTNVGFARGNNLGAAATSSEYLFFLGPDTWLDPDCLSQLICLSRAVKKDNYILAPRQLSYHGQAKILDGVVTDLWQFPYKIYDADRPNQTKPIFYCDGTGIFLPRRTFERLGQFDDKLFMFCEDIDLSWRAHLQDVPVLPAPQAIVHHYSGGSITGGIRKTEKYQTTYLRRYLGEKNTVRNFLKNYSLPVLLLILPSYFLINLVEIAVFLVFGRFKVAKQYLAAWWWNLKHINSTLKLRQKIQATRRVKDSTILSRLYWGSGKFNAFIHIKIPTFQ